MVHQYKLNGYNIIIDEGSGSVHSVDEVAYDMIEMYRQNSKNEIISALLKKYACRNDVTQQELEDCYDDITQLKNEGKLFADSSYAQKAIDFQQ